MSPLGDGGRRRRDGYSRRDGYWVSETVTTKTTPKKIPAFELPEEPGEGAGVVTKSGAQFIHRGDRWHGPDGTETWRDLLYFDGPVDLSRLPDDMTTAAGVDAEIARLQAELGKATEKLEEEPPAGSIAVDTYRATWKRVGAYWQWRNSAGQVTKTTDWQTLNSVFGPLHVVRATAPSATLKVNAEVDKVALPEQPGEMGIVIDKDGMAWQRTGEYWTGNAGEKVWGHLLHWNGPVTVLHTGHKG